MIGNTELGNAQILTEEAKAHQKVATMNAQAAVKTAEDTRNELGERVSQLEKVVTTLIQQNQELNRKYNLLLSERFNTGPTDGNHG